MNVAVHDDHHFETLCYKDGGERPPRFHIVGEAEVQNDVLVHTVAAMMGKQPEIEYVSFHASRPGHDLRYALDGRKIAALGWAPPVALLPSLERTVAWTMAHQEWLETK